MANQEQLSILKQGVEAWNKWREENPYTHVDLSSAELNWNPHWEPVIPNMDITEATSFSDGHPVSSAFRGINFKNADLSKAKLTYCDLREAILTSAGLEGANLAGAHLTGADLSQARFLETDVSGANLDNAHLCNAILYDTNLSESSLIEADLRDMHALKCEFMEADLTGADLRNATLQWARLDGANLSGADLTGADLSNSSWVWVEVGDAKISGSKIYGVNVWDLRGELKEQKDLIISPSQKSIITVDNIKVAQFIYLILNNQEIREAINTLTSKTVLILGRFALPDRKDILDALRNKLREYNLLPIVFDFDRPADKDFTETIKTLAGLCYFVIADITNPKSSPLELQATIPDYQIPFVPIIQEGEKPFAMMADLQKKYNWVLKTRSYSSKEVLISKLKEGIIDPAMEKHNELRRIKAQEPDIVSLG